MQQVGAARIQGFGTSIFTEMTRLAIKHQAVNLGQGFPDFAGPDFVKEAAAAAIFADHNQYAPSHGVPRLRNAIAATWGATYGREIDPDSEVTVTTGATEGMLAALLALVDPGDEVILFEPFYDAYVGDITYAGGVPRYVTLQPPDWSFDPDALAAAFNEKTKVIILNTPHNPTGKVFSRDDLARIAALCQQHDVDRDHRRGLRPDHLRRRGACAARDAARHVGADADAQQHGQDLQHDGLEDRLRDRPGASQRRAAHRPSVQRLRHRDALPGGDGDRLPGGRGARLLRATEARLHRPARRDARHARRRGAADTRGGRHLLPPRRCRAASASRTMSRPAST